MSLSVARTSTFSVLTMTVTHRDYCLAIKAQLWLLAEVIHGSNSKNAFYLLAFHTPKYVNMGPRFKVRETLFKFPFKMKWCRMTMWLNLFKTSRVMPQQTVTVLTRLSN